MLLNLKRKGTENKTRSFNSILDTGKSNHSLLFNVKQRVPLDQGSTKSNFLTGIIFVFHCMHSRLSGISSSYSFSLNLPLILFSLETFFLLCIFYVCLVVLGTEPRFFILGKCSVIKLYISISPTLFFKNFILNTLVLNLHCSPDCSQAFGPSVLAPSQAAAVPSFLGIQNMQASPCGYQEIVFNHFSPLCWTFLLLFLILFYLINKCYVSILKNSFINWEKQLRQEDCRKFSTSLGYRARPCLHSNTAEDNSVLLCPTFPKKSLF